METDPLTDESKFNDPFQICEKKTSSSGTTNKTEPKDLATIQRIAPSEDENKVKEISTMVSEIDISAHGVSNLKSNMADKAVVVSDKVDGACQIPEIANKTTSTSIDEDILRITQSVGVETTVDADTQIESELIESPQQIEGNTIPHNKIQKICREQQTDVMLEECSKDKGTVMEKREADEMEVSTDSDMICSLMTVHTEEENARLVNQSSESFEEELPYVATTLPSERSVAVPIIPVKERGIVEVKTCPVHRPRSTMSLNPALLDNYVAATTTSNLPVATENLPPHSSSEKLHITLPRSEGMSSESTTKVKSPLTMKPWKQFIEEGGIPQSPKRSNSIQNKISDKQQVVESVAQAPSLLPPKNSATWISFDETNQEVRQSPKKITTLPSSHYADSAAALQKAVNRFSQKMTFVNPDECSCECHESQRTTDSTENKDQLARIDK